MAEIRRQRKMQIAVLGMAKEHGVGIPVRGEQGTQSAHPHRQFSHRKGHVFDDHRGARCPHRSHRGKQPFADCPIAGLQRGITGEAQLRQQAHGLTQRKGIIVLQFDQQRGRLAHGQWLRHFRGDPRQTDAVEQLDRGGMCSQRGHRRTGRFDIGIDMPGGGPVLGHRHGVEHGRSDERQRALAADDQLLQNACRLLFVQKSIQRIADGVLGREGALDARHQGCVRAYLITQRAQPCVQCGSLSCELGIIMRMEVKPVG